MSHTLTLDLNLFAPREAVEAYYSGDIKYFMLATNGSEDYRCFDHFVKMEVITKDMSSVRTIIITVPAHVSVMTVTFLENLMQPFVRDTPYGDTYHIPGVLFILRTEVDESLFAEQNRTLYETLQVHIRNFEFAQECMWCMKRADDYSRTPDGIAARERDRAYLDKMFGSENTPL